MEPQKAKRAKSLIASGVLIALILLAGIWVVFFSGNEKAPGQNGTTGGKPTEVQRVDKGPSGVSLDCVLSPTKEWPDDDFVEDWVDVGKGLKVPTAKKQGPGVKAGVSHCYAKSDMGALLAAANWTIWVTSGQNKAEVYKTLIYPDDIGKEAIELMAQSTDRTEASQPDLRGWTIIAPEEDIRLVHVAFSPVNQSTKVLSLQVILKWDGTDWKVILPSRSAPPVLEVPDPAGSGYKRW